MIKTIIENPVVSQMKPYDSLERKVSAEELHGLINQVTRLAIEMQECWKTLQEVQVLLDEVVLEGKQ